MTARFYFKCRGKFTGSFKSTEGEEYTVRVESKFKTLSLYWKEASRSSKFVRVFTFFSRSMQKSGHKALLVEGNKTRAFFYDLDLSSSDHILIVVSTCTPCKPLDEKAAGQKLTPMIAKPEDEKRLEQLSTDIRNLLQTGHLSDVVITAGSKDIHAHKLILSTRSSVFAKMFQHSMKESLENRITIKDVSHEVLLQLFSFMYSGSVMIKDSGMARDLYIAADKYDVKELKEICSTMLKSTDLNSVLDTLLLADWYSDKTLKGAALDFILKRYSKVKALQKWSSFMKEHHNLAIEILNFVIDRK